jgi:hypothetical protein
MPRTMQGLGTPIPFAASGLQEMGGGGWLLLGPVRYHLPVCMYPGATAASGTDVCTPTAPRGYRLLFVCLERTRTSVQGPAIRWEVELEIIYAQVC